MFDFIYMNLKKKTGTTKRFRNAHLGGMISNQGKYCLTSQIGYL